MASIIFAVIAIFLLFSFQFVGVGYGNNVPVPSLLVWGHVIDPVMELAIFLGGNSLGLVIDFILECFYIYFLISLLSWFVDLVRRKRN